LPVINSPAIVRLTPSPSYELRAAINRRRLRINSAIRTTVEPEIGAFDELAACLTSEPNLPVLSEAWSEIRARL
jgi:hypothetical protein